MRQNGFIITLILIIFSFLIFIQTGWAIERRGIVLTVEGNGDILIGEPPPKGIKCGARNGIQVVCENGKVKEASTTSSKVYISRSRVRVGNGLDDLIRFYGKGKTQIEWDRIYIRYPDIGIDFEVNKKNERITRIRVYIPMLYEPTIDQRRYKEQFKK